MLTGDQLDRLYTALQLGKCATMDPEDIDVVGTRVLTTATTLTPSDYRLLLLMYNSWQLTLPAGLYPGYRCTLANEGVGVITLAPASGSIAGRTSIALYPGETFDLVYTGSAWRCPGRNRAVLLSQTVVSAATAQIDLTRGFADDPEITGMRIEYNGLSASATGTMTLSGLSPTEFAPDYASVNVATNPAGVTGVGGANTNVYLNTISTVLANGGGGVLDVAFMPSGLATVTGTSVITPGSTTTMRTVAACFRSAALTGLRMSVASATFSTARVMQYGFRGA